MKIFTVSGASSGVGKTEIATLLLKNLPHWAAVKITVCYHFPCPRLPGCGICQKPPKTFSIITNPKIINQKGKDTSYLSQATRGPVLWIKTRPEFILEAFQKALELIHSKDQVSHITNHPGLLIETTSLLKYIQPDFALLVTRPEITDFKPSALQIINKIDLFVINNSNNASHTTIKNHIQHLQTLNPDAPVFTLNPKDPQSQKNFLHQIISSIL